MTTFMYGRLTKDVRRKIEADSWVQIGLGEMIRGHGRGRGVD